MVYKRKWLIGVCLLGCIGLTNCKKNGGGDGSDTIQSHLDYDDSASKLLVVLNRDLRGDEILHARVRSLSEGDTLDCATMSPEIPTLTESRGNAEYVGPTVEQSMFEEAPTTPETLLNPSEEDFQARQDKTYFVDVCVMKGDGVAHEARYDLKQALDSLGGGKGDEFDDGHRIESNQAYATACISAMGDIPFWDRLDDGGSGEMVQGVEEGTPLGNAIRDYANEASPEELAALIDDRAAEAIASNRPFDSLAALDEANYVEEEAFRALTNHVQENDLVAETESSFDWSTVDCTEVGTPIPTEVDGEPVDHWPDQCDNPQTIYSHCEPDARTGANGPRVASARNSQGTHWVLLCRKSHDAQGRYEDIAMIGHNPFTGQTCYFQNQLPPGETPRPSNNGMKIPHPADDVSSDESPQVWNDLWMGIQGGPNDGIGCQGCHAAEPFIHSPWIDGAKREDGTPVVPRMGDHPDFVEGYGGPYSLIDAQDQGWNQPVHLVSEEANACTRCHRIALDQWTASSSVTARSNEGGGCVFCGQAPWLNRMDHNASAWDGLLTETAMEFDNYYWMPPDADEVLNEELWPESEYAQAMDFIRECGANPDNPECEWETIPTVPGDPTELPQVDLTGEDLAREALAILGAPYENAMGEEVEGTRRCAECHATSTFGFQDWLERTQQANRQGIDVHADPNDLTQEDALELVNYMRKDGEGTVFAAAKIGILTAGAQFPYYKKLFQRAYGNDWGVPYGKFLSRVSMPKGSHPPFSAEEFAIVEKWFVQEELANLEDLIVEVPPPASCADVRDRYNVEGAAPWLENHIMDMEFDGWGARNADNGINMYGCSGGSGLDCFTGGEFTEASDWTASDIADSRLVKVRDFDFNTSFWMRSSADGRFVGNGGSGGANHGATITDLVTGENIGVRGSYDPGFFPNNDGFIMQGGGAGLCGQSVLTNMELTSDGIDFSEPGCTTAEGINLYQHVAVSTEGGDYFVINSQFTSDAGGGTSDPRAPFSEGSTMKFTPMVFDGTEWQQKPQVIVDSPYEGDSVLSPSGKMVISRFAGPEGDALGYMLRRVDATPNGESYDINIDTPLQFVCAPGAKANISFDERYSVTHVYEDGTANIYLTDLLTGDTVQVTDMPEGTRALFPHFRSDGWIYFLAKGDTDTAVASDAALRMAAAQ